MKFCNYFDFKRNYQKMQFLYNFMYYYYEYNNLNENLIKNLNKKSFFIKKIISKIKKRYETDKLFN